MSSHGGKRDGAGRPQALEPRVKVSFYISTGQEIWLRGYTDRHGHTSLSASIRQIIDNERIRACYNGESNCSQ